MKRKHLRMSAAVMAALLTVQGLAIPVSAEDKITKVRSESQVQMNSEPETVYVGSVSAEERSQNFDGNWKFNLGDVAGAQSSAFDDSKWRSINLPHDYSIEQPFSQTMEAESGYLPGGTGWYRKNFTVGENLRGRQIRIDFDGVYMNSTVYVNGTQLGTHPYGYTPFSFDITDYVKYGEENVIAVKVDHRTPSSRWYSGSGIYRSVNLTVTDKVCVDLNGTRVESPNLKTEKGGDVTVNVTTTVANHSADAANVTLTHTIFEKGTDNQIGQVTTAAESVAANGTKDIAATMKASNPKLWDFKTPVLYTIRTEVKAGDKVVDTYDTEYGFRYTETSTDTGFSLNGKNVKLKGVCMHHDQGSLGAVANRRAIERQVEILKAMGCNSIRVTHNQAAQHLIDVCNEQGILVIEEIFDGWHKSKNENYNDYATAFAKAIESNNEILGKRSGMTWAEFDIKSTIMKHRNAPSIIMWSLGNEIQEGASNGGYEAHADNLIRWAQEVDTSKDLTIGSNQVKGKNPEMISIGNKVTAAGGVSGTNYSDGASYDDLHRSYPNWKILGSETASAVTSRGIYTTKANNSLNADKQLTSYDKSKVNWGAFASSAWYDVITRDFMLGEYVWTGFDYIGEPTPANKITAGAATSWPSPKNSYFGIVDTAGFPKDSYYLYQSMWNDDVNTLHVLPAWNSDCVVKDGSGSVEVVVYSDAPTVELWLNDTLIDTQKMVTKTTAAGHKYQMLEGGNATHTNLYRTFWVPYADGTLKAVAKDENGKVIEKTEGRSVIKTAGTAAKLAASADHKTITADGKDLAYITVDVTDANGNIVPNAADRVTFKVEGDGVLVGVDNGSSPDHDSYQLNNRKAFSGKVLAIVQSTKNAGNIKVTASAAGLESSVVNVKTTAEETGAVERRVESFYMSKTYYIKAGNIPTLPETIVANYTDGSAEDLPVVWDKITEDQVAQTGRITVKGQVEGGYDVAVNVNVIDKIGGILNYSTTVPVGTKPVLPVTRPVVMQDGTVATTAFEVDWNEPSDDVYNKEGIVKVTGTADVLGQAVEVTASIRVQKENVTIGDSISSVGRLTQSVPAGQQSDTLEAIKDGSTAISDNNQGGANPSCWSNYDYSQSGAADANKADITFAYDTQQRFGQFVIYFAKDGYSARYPEAGTTEIYISETGNEGSWTKLDAAETIGTENGRVTPYTYDFTPVTATFVKFCFTNKNETLAGRKPCTAITEIALKEAKGAFVTNTTADLESVKVNGADVPAADIEAGSYTTAAMFAEVEAQPADNAAVTVLQAYEDVIRVIVESEDHNTRETFEVHLNGDLPPVEIPADDNSRDYPAAQCEAFADSQYLPGTANEGPVRFVLDNNGATWWHTNWQTTEGQNVNKRWIGLTLKEATELDAVRYLPRGGNGDVTAYKVQYRASETDEWSDIGSGTWTRDGQNWKLAVFDQPVVAKQVRLIGVHTYADSGNDAHMSVAELRARKAADKTDISDEANGITVDDIEPIVVDVVDEAHPVFVNPVVKNGESALHYGADYVLAFADNTAIGTATVTITGIGSYTGEIVKTFEIKKAEPDLTAVYVKDGSVKTAYTEGETFDPTGLELTLVYSDGSENTVVYGDDTADDFAFEPALSTALTTDMEEVTISYAGFTADVAITVAPKTVAPKTEFTVTVDGTVLGTDYHYNDPVTVTAPDAPQGQKFAGWEVDGSIVSTAKKYTFYVSNDIEVTSKFVDADETVTQEASALLTNAFATKRESDGKSDIKFVAQLVIPEGYKLVEAGLELEYKPDAELSLDNKALKPTCITAISTSNQFSVTIKGLPQGKFIRGKVFATVIDDKGVEKVIYSATESKVSAL